MSIPVCQPRKALGLKTGIKGNANFITDEDIVYPVGSVLSIHNFNQKKQKFIKLPEKGSNVIEIAVSPNRSLVAVSEKGKSPSVTLYDPFTYKKKRTITIPPDRESTATEFTTMAFSFDSKYIFMVAGEPDWVMYTFKCDRGRLESFTRANNSNGTGTVVQVCPNPNDGALLVLVGNGIYRIMSSTEAVWRQYGFSKADQLNLTSAAWISQDRILAGCVNGKLLLVENGDLKAIYEAVDLPSINLKIKEE